MPDGIAVPAGNGYLIVTNPGDQGVSVFGERTAGAFIGTINAGGQTKHVQFSHDQLQASQQQSGQETSDHTTFYMTASFGSLAPGNATPWYKNACVTHALGAGALSVGIDSIGLIPEAEGFTKAFENEAGYQIARAVGHSAGYRGVVATQYGMKAVAQGKLGGALVGGALGLGDTSVGGRISTGLTIAGFIPGAGTVVAVVSIVVDVVKTGVKIAECP